MRTKASRALSVFKDYSEARSWRTKQGTVKTGVGSQTLQGLLGLCKEFYFYFCLAVGINQESQVMLRTQATLRVILKAQQEFFLS